MNEWKSVCQLWCYYELDDRWVMEGFFRTPEQAEKRLRELREDGDTPCMPDWAITQVKAQW